MVDAYTRRILARHEILPEKAPYEEIWALFERALAPLAPSIGDSGKVENQRVGGGLSRHRAYPSSMSTANRTALVQVYNEMHGLIVGVGKNYCRKSQARCDECPLQKFLPRV